jgi:hypothetical protein
MANSYYTHSAYPATNSNGSSSAMRAELDAIMAGFALLPTALGLGQQGFSGGRWSNATLVGGSIDNVVIGGSAPVAGTFAALGATGLATLAAGGSFSGTFTALAGAILSAFAITGGSINNTPIGATTASTGTFTLLTVNGATAHNGTMSVSGAFSSTTGMDMGNKSAASSPTLNFRSSGSAPNFDSRIAPSGGTGTDGAGTITYTAAVHAFNTRPSFNGAIPWDSLNVPNPFQTTGGTITGPTSFSSRPVFNGATPWDSANVPYPFQTTGGTITGPTSFSQRPTFNGATPWDSSNFTPANYVAKVGDTINGRLVFTQSGSYGELALQSTDGTRMYLRGRGSGGGFEFVNSAYNAVVGHVDDVGNIYGAGTVYSGSGAAWLATNGDTYGPAWNGYLSSYISTQVSNLQTNINARAAGSATCQYNTGVVEFAQLDGRTTTTVDVGAPYVVCGARAGVSTDINRIWLHGVQLRNQ